MNNCTIILFGASGDLARRKIIPALYHMFAAGKLTQFLLICIARDALSSADMLERSRPFIGRIDENVLQELKNNIIYHQLDFNDAAAYAPLHARIAHAEQERLLSGNRLIYFAVAAHFYCTITRLIYKHSIAKRCQQDETRWDRLIYEKPFGHDAQSAKEINRCIQECFNEHQIYRIDHFLSKELVGNIALIRFTNCFFEPLWNHNYIDQVQILLSETVSIEGRGSYYDAYGAVCDVVQNHMLEMLALIAMEAPSVLAGDAIRDARAKVLQQIRFVDGILGQYEGYKNEMHVAPDSTTETFAALVLEIDNKRWQGVPFVLKTGKKMAKKETAIHIIFKPATCILAKACPNKANALTIEISPQAGFKLQMNAKKIGAVDEVMPINLDYCHSCLYGPHTPEDYQTLFEEIMKGEQSIVVRFDEIEHAWKITDDIKKATLPLYEYQGNSNGPAQLHEFNQKYDIRWKE